MLYSNIDAVLSSGVSTRLLSSLDGRPAEFEQARTFTGDLKPISEHTVRLGPAHHPVSTPYALQWGYHWARSSISGFRKMTRADAFYTLAVMALAF